MQRTNGKGLSVLNILKNGASCVHFEGLQNSSRLLARLGERGSQLAVGTTRNEQLHRELKCWSQNIYQSHRGRLQNGLRIFELAKLLTHSSAAYSPTLVQTTQQRLLFMMAGKLRKSGFFSFPSPCKINSADNVSQKKKSLNTTYREYDTSSAQARKIRVKANKQNWGKRKKPDRKRYFKRYRYIQKKKGKKAISSTF